MMHHLFLIVCDHSKHLKWTIERSLNANLRSHIQLNLMFFPLIKKKITYSRPLIVFAVCKMSPNAEDDNLEEIFTNCLRKIWFLIILSDYPLTLDALLTCARRALSRSPQALLQYWLLEATMRLNAHTLTKWNSWENSWMVRAALTRHLLSRAIADASTPNTCERI